MVWTGGGSDSSEQAIAEAYAVTWWQVTRNAVVALAFAAAGFPGVNQPNELAVFLG